MGKNAERQTFNLVALKSTLVTWARHTAQGLMQRKVAPSWPGVKTLINTHMRLFSQAGEPDEAALCSLSHLHFRHIL